MNKTRLPWKGCLNSLQQNETHSHVNTKSGALLLSVCAREVSGVQEWKLLNFIWKLCHFLIFLTKTMSQQSKAIQQKASIPSLFLRSREKKVSRRETLWTSDLHAREWGRKGRSVPGFLLSLWPRSQTSDIKRDAQSLNRIILWLNNSTSSRARFMSESCFTSVFLLVSITLWRPRTM